MANKTKGGYMRRKYSYLFSLILLAAAVSGVLLLNVDRANAQFLDCDIQLFKLAPGAGDLEFEFHGVDENSDEFSLFIPDGGETGFGVEDGTTTVITENPQSGWAFGGIECETGPGVIITETENGFTIDCMNEKTGQASCLVTNVRSVSNVPTLSEWGMIAAAAGLMIVGVFFAVRRSRAAVSA
jgi:hypothetical protein